MQKMVLKIIAKCLANVFNSFVFLIICGFDFQGLSNDTDFIYFYIWMDLNLVNISSNE